MKRDLIRQRFEERKLQNVALLAATLRPGFKFKKVTATGEVDATEEYRAQLRQVIADYQRAVDMLGPSA